MKLKILFAILMFFMTCFVSKGQLPTNNDPGNQIRFKTQEQAEARRDQLIRFIWKDGLPKNTLPAVILDKTGQALSGHLELINEKLVSQVDQLEVESLGFTSLSYLIHPVKKVDKPGLAIVQAGHSPAGQDLNESYQSSIDLFLERGYHVMMFHMPMRGWNMDFTAELPNGIKISVDAGCPKGYRHDVIVKLVEMDDNLEPGAGFRPFLEPVVAGINYWDFINDGNENIIMIGLSGGGWTTHMAAAIDTRIKLSFPVAGSYPLYLRNISDYAGSVGDLEQYYFPLYDENIAENGTGGGIATWLEIYTLGGLGNGRKQIMVTSQFDNCCFNGDPEITVNTFKNIVSEAVNNLGQGYWEHMLDTTHHEHKISAWTLKNAVMPNLPSLP